MATVSAVCVSDVTGVVKTPVPEIFVKKNHGVVSDAHAGNWHRQVSLLADESVDKLRDRMPQLSAGMFAENILTRGVCLYELPVGAKIRVGGSLMEISQIGKECHHGCAIKQTTGDCVMPREGIFAIVLEGGAIKPGDQLDVVPDTTAQDRWRRDMELGYPVRG